MKRIIYHNITFQCNNRCIHCISKSVKTLSKDVIKVDDIQFVDKIFNVNEEDVWNINGGEPTLSEHFGSIIDFCHTKSPHIIVYSNGRNLINISKSLLSKVERIIVPIYGDELSHNFYVGDTNAYKETCISLEDIIARFPQKVDIKLLLDDNNNIEKFFKTIEWDKIRDNIHFSITRILKGYHDKTICSPQIAERAEIIIEKFIEQNKKVRFYDIPFCLFSRQFQKKISQMEISKSEEYDKTIIMGYGNFRYKTVNYSEPTNIFKKCLLCSNHIYCTQIMHNYFCPMIYDDKIYLSTE